MRLMTIFLAATLTATPALAQQGPPPFDHSILAFFGKLVGEWSGTAWIIQGPEGRHDAVQRESVKWVAGKTALAIEGLGHEKMPDGTMRVVHDAYATIFVNRETKTPWMRAFLATGQYQDVEITPRPNGYEWGMTVGPGIKVRYEMHFDAEGRWVEKGFMSRDAGATWVPFMEMTLSRVKP